MRAVRSGAGGCGACADNSRAASRLIGLTAAPTSRPALIQCWRKHSIAGLHRFPTQEKITLLNDRKSRNATII